MKLKAKIAKLEDVPEGHRGYYQAAADNSGFTLKDEFEIPDPPDVTGLTANRDTILREKTALEERFKDLDPVAARAAIAEVAKLKGTAQTEADRIKKIEDDLAKEKQDRAAADIRANTQLVKAEGSTAIAKHKGNSTLLMPFVERRSGVVDGVLTVFQEDGKTPMLDAAQKPVTMDGLIQSFKSQEVFAGAFEASEAGGSGSPAGGSAQKLAPGLVSVADSAGMGANLEKIASGEVTVVAPTT
jgi:hypothetical protein